MNEWRPDRLSRRLPHLQLRARIQAAMRQWFESEGFVEVVVRGGPGEPTLGLDAPRCVIVGRRPA